MTVSVTFLLVVATAWSQIVAGQSARSGALEVSVSSGLAAFEAAWYTATGDRRSCEATSGGRCSIANAVQLAGTYRLLVHRIPDAAWPDDPLALPPLADTEQLILQLDGDEGRIRALRAFHWSVQIEHMAPRSVSLHEGSAHEWTLVNGSSDSLELPIDYGAAVSTVQWRTSHGSWVDAEVRPSFDHDDVGSVGVGTIAPGAVIELRPDVAVIRALERVHGTANVRLAVRYNYRSGALETQPAGLGTYSEWTIVSAPSE